MLQTFTLKNGLKVATYSLPHLKSVALDIAVKSGSFYETSKNSGTSHLMEHLLLEGTPTYPTPQSLTEFIESLAGTYNAYTSSYTVYFVANVPVTKLDEILKLSAEVFYQPLFTSESVEKERKAILQEVKQRQDNLHYKIGSFFRDNFYKKGHPYLLDAQSQFEAIPNLTREDLINWWKKFFVTDNTYLVLVGGFKSDEAKKLVEDYFGEIKAEGKLIKRPKYSNDDLQDRKTAIRFDDKLESCYVDMAWASINYEVDPKIRGTQRIISSILGGLSSSRLYKLLRLEKGLVYGVNTGTSATFGFGSFYLSTQVIKENLDEVLDLIVKELSQFMQTGPTKEEVEFAKNYSVNRVLMSWDQPSNIAGWIKEDLLWEEKIETPEEYVKTLESITADDVVDFMKKYWDFSKLLLTIQGPVKNSKENVKKYTKMVEVLK